MQSFSYFRNQNVKGALKVENGQLLSTLAPLCPPPSPARTGQLWETSGRRSPDVSQTSPRPVSASASAAGFVRQGVSVGEWEDAPPHSYHRRWVIWYVFTLHLPYLLYIYYSISWLNLVTGGFYSVKHGDQIFRVDFVNSVTVP